MKQSKQSKQKKQIFDQVYIQPEDRPGLLSKICDAGYIEYFRSRDKQQLERKPDEEEIEICCKWFVENYYNGRVKFSAKKENTGSYRLKHVIERESGKYISNGSCAAALVKMGICIEPEEKGKSPNFDIKIMLTDYDRRAK